MTSSRAARGSHATSADSLATPLWAATEVVVEHIDVDEIIADLRKRVARRRAEGDYPLGLEEQMEAEFDAIMKGVHRDEIDTRTLASRVDGLFEVTQAINVDVRTSSRMPGGSVVHGTAGRIIQRHTGHLADHLRTLLWDVAVALREVQYLIDAQRSADERQLREVIASVIDRIAVLDHLASAVVDLERRVDALEQAPTDPPT